MSEMNMPFKDQDMLTDMLTTEKYITSAYNMAVTESAEKNLRQLFNTNLNQSFTDQYDVFDAMSTRGFYPIKPANPQEISTTVQKYEQKKNELH